MTGRQLGQCSLCNGDSFAEVYPCREARMVRCRACDLVQFRPLPAPELLADYYSSRSGYLPSIEQNLQSFRRTPEVWRATAEAILARLAPHQRRRQRLRVLDIGAAYGFFLTFAREAGHEAHGVEVSRETSEHARAQGLDVRTGTLAEAGFSDGWFDVVVLNNVLEHSRDPVAELRGVHRVLAQDGLAYVAVPNFDSLVARVDNFYWKMKSWPNHLYYFTAPTLRGCLAAAGLLPVEEFTQQGESDPWDDRRVVRDRLQLEQEEHITAALELLCRIGKAQELVVLARRSG